MQWKGPFEIVTTVGTNDYRINMGGKEKTFHANLLKAYIARDQDANQENTDERPPTSSSAIPAASVTVSHRVGREFIENTQSTQRVHRDHRDCSGINKDGCQLGVVYNLFIPLASPNKRLGV
ncbi:Zinc finger protein [Plakobranchus ocellatus]|uniref:Zinc finger protein n=1 Tax=Plakobranchus ocellatus TaxID=259542 RepID=A0AAV3Z6G7_9GAST|nr:Zinc finger protein [Plakobranchus ocellatus]